MNRKIGMYSAAVNAASVLAFAVFMLAGFTHGCYFASMFIAFSFVPMMCDTPVPLRRSGKRRAIPPLLSPRHMRP